MQREELPVTHFANMGKDFRAEVTAAEIAELGTQADRILILMIGAMKRPHQMDIVSIEEELSKHDRKEYVIVKHQGKVFMTCFRKDFSITLHPISLLKRKKRLLKQ
jgi:hypothetical protein